MTPNQAKGWIAERDFVSACAALPLVSIDFVIVTPQLNVLLGLRKNAPARELWFTPGGRVRKNESLADARARIWDEELGQLHSPESSVLMGAWDHFYEDSAFDAAISTHYVNLPHLVLWPSVDEFAIADLPLDQHSEWRWWSVEEAEYSPLVHPYVQAYARYAMDRQRVKPLAKVIHP